MRFIFILSGLLLSFSAHAGFEDHLKKLKNTQVSAQVVNLAQGKVLLSVDADTPLNPASSVKLFTGYAALKKLGVNHVFKTEFYYDKSQNFCVKGSGDPIFVMEDMYLVVEALKRRGIEEFSGQVTLDATAFDQELYPEDRSEQDSERAYNAPIAGLNFNYNTISVFVNPTKKGMQAKVGLDFPFEFVKVNGKVMTGSSTEVTWDKKGKDDLELVYVGGRIASDADEWRKPFRIRDPVRAFGEAFYKMLGRGGIVLKRKIEVKQGKCFGQLVYVHQSRPLSYTVGLMNKYSNNFIADSLVKAIDHEINERSGSATGGMRMIRAEMKEMGIEPESKGRAVVAGSGLTLGNKLSASDFIKLLKHMDKEKLYLPEMLTSLPLAGLDGTLKKKYVRSPVEGKLRGKTGTLNGVQSIVGVYPAKNGDWIGVAIIVNGANGIPESDLASFLKSL